MAERNLADLAAVTPAYGRTVSLADLFRHSSNIDDMRGMRPPDLLSYHGAVMTPEQAIRAAMGGPDTPLSADVTEYGERSYERQPGYRPSFAVRPAPSFGDYLALRELDDEIRRRDRRS